MEAVSPKSGVLKLVLSVVLAILFVIAVASMVAGDGEPAGIVQTLEFVAFSGAFVGALVSGSLEEFDWFDTLEPTAKRAVVGLFVFALPLIAMILLTVVPPEVYETLNPFWPPLMTAIIGWVGSQVYHKFMHVRR